MLRMKQKGSPSDERVPDARSFVRLGLDDPVA
jgi:hypothetical protein